MNNDLDKGDPVEKVMTEASTAEDFHAHRLDPGPVSPLGWSISSRLLCAAAAAALLWLAVAWAIGWLG